MPESKKIKKLSRKGREKFKKLKVQLLEKVEKDTGFKNCTIKHKDFEKLKFKKELQLCAVPTNIPGFKYELRKDTNYKLVQNIQRIKKILEEKKSQEKVIEVIQID